MRSNTSVPVCDEETQDQQHSKEESSPDSPALPFLDDVVMIDDMNNMSSDWSPPSLPAFPLTMGCTDRETGLPCHSV